MYTTISKYVQIYENGTVYSDNNAKNCYFCIKINDIQ